MPKNPYGESKLAADNIIEEFCSNDHLRAIIFRFFNVYGDYKTNQYVLLEEKHVPETHLIPIVIENIKKNKDIPVFGLSWDTPDGTCIRDYLHVLDLTDACLIASKRLESIKFEVINLGTGIGHSVLSVISAIESKLGMSAKIKFLNKRPGDAKRLVAEISKAKEILGWTPKNML
jgi:UDP-glucose 4-epimerase